MLKGVKSNDPSEPKTTITEAAIRNDVGNHNQTNKSNLFEDSSSHVGISVQEKNRIGEAQNHLDGNGVIDSEKAVSVPSSVEIPVENGNLKQIQPETAVKVIPDKALSSGHIEEGHILKNCGYPLICAHIRPSPIINQAL